ncbi:hypothetical protein [Psychroflexus sp. ALD_RP9]|uniref:hypothetical protein n=1 Tax=Psychroflexus sp. ALD_RP9 TaxID=2777186 RepID=UPI001A8CA9D8|nr:hypothetical protein [Psychroflexus sp. ALD_RP9]QSS97228.1 hypothetical protein IMZ30_00475 [Psychroflexus sp. ALD_RP9]
MKLDITRIRLLIAKYENAETSLQEEQELYNYFLENEAIPEDLKVYQHIFLGFNQLKNQNLEQELNQVEMTDKSNSKYVWYKIAAALIIALITSVFIFNSNQLSTQEEREARKALAQTVAILKAVSSEINQNTEKLKYINKFKSSTNKYLK